MSDRAFDARVRTAGKVKASAAKAPTFTVWRHPKPVGASGLCVGAGCDLPVPARRAKRLARRIQAHARRHRLPHDIWTSPLQRCADVGRWLRRWGWRHHVDARLSELDFGTWDGRPWSDIPKDEIDTWVQDFAQGRPGGGESLSALIERVTAWDGDRAGALVVSHGGWMLARRWASEHPGQTPAAHQWPTPPRYMEPWALPAGISASPASAVLKPLPSAADTSASRSPASPHAPD